MADVATMACLEERPLVLDVDSDTRLTGWNAGEDGAGDQSIHYRPSNHGDPVIRAWIEFTVNSRHAANEPDSRRMIDAALDYLLDQNDGPGGCGKCHSSGIMTSNSDAPIQWAYRGAITRPHTPFSHVPHINLMGPNASC